MSVTVPGELTAEDSPLTLDTNGQGEGKEELTEGEREGGRRDEGGGMIEGGGEEGGSEGN